MLEFSTKYEFNIDLKNTYKERYILDRTNYEPLHQYLLAILYGSTFVDTKTGTTNQNEIIELYNALSLITDTDEAEAYEALFYYDINRAWDKNDVNTEWLREHPQYRENCLLNELSFDFLVHIGMFDAAQTVCHDLYNTFRYTYNEYAQKLTDILCKQNKHNEAFDFLATIVKETNGYVGPFVFGKAFSLCWKLDRVEEMLEMCRNCVAKQPHVKWISKEYISVCLKLDLEEEALKEYERLLGIILFLYKDSVITAENCRLFKYFLAVRKLLNMGFEPEEVAQELGLTINIQRTPNEGKREARGNSRNQGQNLSPWENDSNNKAMLKRVTKMNKPFKTYTKLFAGGERELIHAKSILASYLSIIKERLGALFGTNTFEVTDYDLFYEAFPFYSLNGFADEEIDEVLALLKKLHAVSIQLNPFVSSRSYILDSLVSDILSVNKEIDLGNKKYEYIVSDKATNQITVFGAILLISTFLNNEEKNAFAFDLSGSDVKISTPFLNQILNTIPATKIATDEKSGGARLQKEKTIFSLYLRKEIFRFLLELEASIIKKNHFIEADRPNMNAKYFNQIVEVEFEPHSNEFQSLAFLHDLASEGILISDVFRGSPLMVKQIITALKTGCNHQEFGFLFQAGIESLFTVLVNRKYYNLMKWKQLKSEDHFLRKQADFCKKMVYRNDVLMTEEDEYELSNASTEQIFTYIDDFQRNEFTKLFESKSFKWTKIEYTILSFDLENCSYTLNGEKGAEATILLRPNDNLKVLSSNGQVKTEWRVVGEFDSPLAHCEIREMI